MTTIHNAGSLNIDDDFRTTHIVRPGETIPSASLDRYAGGKGLNQSMALARAGAKVRHVGRIGQDGLFLKDQLAEAGADVDAIIVDQEPTGHAIIQVGNDGENAIVLYGGANLRWTDADIQRLVEKAKPGDVLLLQNEINMPGELIDAAHGASLRIAMNPAPMDDVVGHLPLERLTWLVVNEIEGRELTGLDTEDEEAIAAALRKRCPDTVVVITLGSRGALRADERGMIRADARAPGAVRDTTGAGDTFLGYFLAGEVAGLSAEESLKRGCAAGAIAVTREGATQSIPTMRELEQVLDS